MRAALLAVLLAASLGGCTQQDPGGDDAYGTCPAWIKYPHPAQSVVGELRFTNQTTQPQLTRWDFMAPQGTKRGTGIGDGYLLEYRDHPLDQIVLDFHLRPERGDQRARMLYTQDAELHLRAYASDEGFVGEPVELYDQASGPASAKHEWSFRSDPVTHYAIHNVTLRIDLAPVDGDPAPHGIFLEWEIVPDLDRDIDTPSHGLMHYQPEFWYRTCSADGTRH